MIQRIKRFAAVLVAGTALAGAALAQNVPAPIVNGETIGTQELVNAACKEGKVTYYTAQNGDDERKIVADFEKQFPCIAVNIVAVGTSQLFERIQTEFQAGQVNGDLVILSDVALGEQLFDKGQLAKWTPPADMLAKYPASAKHEGAWYAGSSSLVHPVYNTDNIDKAQIPKSWKDLLKPYWAGKFGSGPVNVGGIQWVQYAFMLDVLGEDYLKAFVAQKPQLYTTYNPLLLGIGRGETLGGVVAALNEYPLRVHQNAPIGVVYPEEGVPISYYPLMLLNKAKNPAAGELLGNYYLSKTGQANLVKTRGAYSLRPDVPSAEGNQPLANLKPWNPGYETIKARHGEVIKKTLEIFGQK